MRKKEDLRIQKTKSTLYRGLMELMKNESFEDIKVSNICSKSKINRSTFYDHFADKYELLQSLMDDLKIELEESLEVTKDTASIKEYYIETVDLLLSHVTDNINIYSSVIKNNKNSIAHDMMVDSVNKFVNNYINENYINESNIPTERLVQFYASGLIAIVFDEMKNPTTFNKDNIVNYIKILIPDMDFLKKK